MRISQLFYIPIDAKRIYGLDILRAFAIIAVMMSHSIPFVSAYYYSFHDTLTFEGVSLFFVLSGFLIGGILIKILDTQKANGKTLVDFWLKRWFRTVPPYFLALLIFMAISWNKPGFKLNYYKEYFVFLQNFKSPHAAFFGEAWSLSIEEWFYLLIPSATFIVISLQGNAKTSLLAVAVSVLLGVTLYRYYKYVHLPPHSLEEWDANFRRIVVTRLDSLMYGVIAAYLSYYKKEYWLKNKGVRFLIGVPLLCLGKLSPAVDSYGLYSCVFSFSLTSIGVMLMLPYLSTIKTGFGWFFRLITRISLISYSTYLLNGSIVSLSIWRPFMDSTGLTGAAYQLVGYTGYWIVTGILATLMYKYFEVPVMNLRSKFIGDKKRTTPAGEVAVFYAKVNALRGRPKKGSEST